MDVSASDRPLTAPERSRRDTRERLVGAGTQLFAERGLHGVTSHEIARAAGVAAGTFYLHFKDKAALFREVVAEAVSHLRARFERVRSVAQTPEEGARLRATELLDFAEENRGLVRILFGRESEAASVAADLLAELAKSAAAALAERVASGNAPTAIDPVVAAEALVGLRARLAAWWAEAPGRVPRARVIDTLVHLELSGVWAAAPSPTPSAPRKPRATETRRR